MSTLIRPDEDVLANAGLSVQQRAAVNLWLDNEEGDDQQHVFVADVPDEETAQCTDCGDNVAGLQHAFDPAAQAFVCWEPIFEVVEGSSFDYLQIQENGDQVDCWECGGTLDDDGDDPIVNDHEGFAYHLSCSKNVKTQVFA